jgi:hypothetical protein
MSFFLRPTFEVQDDEIRHRERYASPGTIPVRITLPTEVYVHMIVLRGKQDFK